METLLWRKTGWRSRWSWSEDSGREAVSHANSLTLRLRATITVSCVPALTVSTYWPLHILSCKWRFETCVVDVCTVSKKKFAWRYSVFSTASQGQITHREGKKTMYCTADTGGQPTRVWHLQVATGSVNSADHENDGFTYRINNVLSNNNRSS